MFVSLVFLCYFYVAEVFMRFSVLISFIFIRCMFFVFSFGSVLLVFLFFISYVLVFLFFVSFIVIIVYFLSFILVHVLLLFQCSIFPFLEYYLLV